MGMSEPVARMLLEMIGAVNSGHMRALEPRTPQNTTPTSYETFVNEVLRPSIPTATSSINNSRRGGRIRPPRKRSERPERMRSGLSDFLFSAIAKRKRPHSSLNVASIYAE